MNKIKHKLPADFVEVFNNTFLLSYELLDWQLNDEIAELIYEEYPNFEIIITEVNKADLFYFKEANKYVKYLFDREQNKN